MQKASRRQFLQKMGASTVFLSCAAAGAAPPTTVSKFLFLGLSVEQAIEKVTAAPTRMLTFPEKIGSLAAGGVADITMSEIRRGEFEFFDSRRAKRTGREKLVPIATVKDGTMAYWEA